jgi:hypothetical protein
VVIVANTVAGLWVLAASRWPRLDHRSMWWFVVGAQASIFVEVAIGAALLSGSDEPRRNFHIFYGFLALVAVAILYSYRAQLRDRVHLLYGLGGLFVTGLLVRAATLRR